MHKKIHGILSGALLLIAPFSLIHANDAQASTPTFHPFTGKVTRNKVRLRLQPNLDGQIIKELVKEDLLVVLGDEEEFYAVEPPKGTKGYVYRTYVLDNVVEGNRVNVRLEPDTESPIIAQLNAGDKVDGIVSPLNSKWLEITPPSSTRLFVCKEYIENVGDAQMITKVEKRRVEVNSLLNSTNLISQSELQKPFEEINLDTVFNNLNKISKLYSDFPDQVARAKEMVSRIQDIYTQKKIAYLEARTAELDQKNSSNTTLLQIKNQQHLDQIEKSLEDAPIYADIPVERIEHNQQLTNSIDQKTQSIDWNHVFDPATKTEKMLAWLPVEKDLYETWAVQNEKPSLSRYYSHQVQDGLVIRGIIEPYHRAIKNKPGDYILVNKITNLPIAYLYSTQVNLQTYLGREITIKVAPRQNNHFAFPAYFVLAIE